MITGIQIFKDDFDNMENRDCEYSTLLGTFIESDNCTAYGNASKFMDKLPPVKHYLGFDRKIYPKYRIEEIKIN